MKLSKWFAALVGALAAPLTWATPFVVELTIPDAHGSLAPPALAESWIPFTASYIVIRATGDTSNVVYRYEDGTKRFQASSVVIEIPGVGAASATGSYAVTARATNLWLESPAYETSFSHGAYATYTANAAYNLTQSVDAIATDDARTFHWGPTSAMVPFTLQANGRVGTVAARGTTGGSLRITTGGNAPNPLAARPYTNLGTFLQATGPNRVATFEDWSGGVSGGVAFPGNALDVVETVKVLEFPNFVDKPHEYWFGALGTRTHFAVDKAGGGRIEAVFPENVQAAGFVFNCYDCHLTPMRYGMVWTTQDADGATIEEGTTMVDLTVSAGATQPGPGFFGLTTTRPFRRLAITKVSPFGQSQPWMIDDVRYATALPAIEYRHEAFGHYFVTSIADEVNKLDDGTFAGWTRTGLRFSAEAPGTTGTMPTCRFFSTAFGERSSHFYTSDAAECALVKNNPSWQFEGTVFGLAPTDADGNCAPGMLPLFRLYNDGRDGAPNHRYTTNFAARQASIEAGWIPEGAGPLGVAACVPRDQ